LRALAVDVRPKLFQTLGELVLVEKFLMAIVDFDEKIYFRLVLLKKVGDLSQSSPAGIRE
jgi:hypothetical protein